MLGRCTRDARICSDTTKTTQLLLFWFVLGALDGGIIPTESLSCQSDSIIFRGGFLVKFHITEAMFLDSSL